MSTTPTPIWAEVQALAVRCAEADDPEIALDFERRFGVTPDAFTALDEHAQQKHVASLAQAKESLGDALNDAAIKRAREAGYTVHAPNAEEGNDSWAFCIEGDYTEGFASEDQAWKAALSDMQEQVNSSEFAKESHGQVQAAPYFVEQALRDAARDGDENARADLAFLDGSAKESPLITPLHIGVAVDATRGVAQQALGDPEVSEHFESRVGICPERFLKMQENQQTQQLCLQIAKEAGRATSYPCADGIQLCAVFIPRSELIGFGRDDYAGEDKVALLGVKNNEVTACRVVNASLVVRLGRAQYRAFAENDLAEFTISRDDTKALADWAYTHHADSLPRYQAKPLQAEESVHPYGIFETQTRKRVFAGKQSECIFFADRLMEAFENGKAVGRSEPLQQPQKLDAMQLVKVQNAIDLALPSENGRDYECGFKDALQSMCLALAEKLDANALQAVINTALDAYGNNVDLDVDDSPSLGM